MNTPQHPDQENANIREIQRGTDDPSDHETSAQTEAREAEEREPLDDHNSDGRGATRLLDAQRESREHPTPKTKALDYTPRLTFAKWREFAEVLQRDLASAEKALRNLGYEKYGFGWAIVVAESEPEAQQSGTPRMGAQTESRERDECGVSEWTHEDIISAFQHERDRSFTANRTCRELRDQLSAVTAELAWTKDGKFEFASELDLARTQRNKFRAERDTSLEAIKAWTKRAAIAETERDTARAHLRKFGRHPEWCGVNNGNAFCTCGFAAALED